jgi:hypothetical protein
MIVVQHLQPCPMCEGGAKVHGLLHDCTNKESGTLVIGH